MFLDSTLSNNYARRFMEGCVHSYQHCTNLLGEFQRVDGNYTFEVEGRIYTVVPSCKTIPFAVKKLPYKRGGFSN